LLITQNVCWSKENADKEANTVKRSPAELLMSIHLKELKLPFQAEYRFRADRKWRFDFLLTESNIALEIDGYFKGRHGAGWGADNEKRRTATLMGYRVLVYSTKEVLTGKAKEELAGYLKP
jgi:very-short-patch-repair endonuclease